MRILIGLTNFKSVVNILSDWANNGYLSEDPPYIKMIEGVNLERFMGKFSGITEESISNIKEQLQDFKTNVIPFIYMKNGLKYTEVQDCTNLTGTERNGLMERVIKKK